MTKVASTEITIDGIVTAVSIPENFQLAELIPLVGQNVFTFGNEVNLLLKRFVDRVYESHTPVESHFTIKDQTVQITGHNYQGEQAFLYWKYEAEPSSLLHRETVSDTNLLQKINSDNLPIVVMELYLYQDGRFEVGYVNNEMYSFFPSFDIDSINSDNALLFKRVHPMDKGKLIASLRSVELTGILDVEYRVLENGETRWINGHGKSVKDTANSRTILSICLLDITDRKVISEKLELIDFIFRKTSMPIILGLSDGTFLDVNETALSFYGYSREEMMQLEVDDLRLNKTKGYAELWNEIKTNKEVTFQSVHKKKDGTLIYVSVVASYLLYGDMEVSSTFISDITEQKSLVEQLKLVDFAFRNSSLPTLIAREDSTFYDFNQAALTLHGYTAEEMSTLRVGNLVLGYPEDNWESAYAEVWAYLKVHKRFEVIVQHKRKDGSVIDVEVMANYIKYGDLELNCSYIIDITEKKKSEEELKRSNDRYAYATLATHDVIWETDLSTNSLYLANNFTAVFGHQLTGIEYGEDNIWRRNLHPDDYEMVLAKEHEVIYGTEDKWESEYRFRKANGTYAVVLERGFCLRNASGKAIRLFGAIQDITEKKKIEEDLKWSNLRYEYATLVTSDVVWESDLKADTLFISKNFTLFFGHKVDGVMPIKDSVWRKNVHPDDLEKVLKSELEVVKGNGDKWECEYRFRKADGSYAIVVDRSLAMKDENGKVVKMIGSMKDITLKKQEEERIKLFETVVQNTTQAVIIRDAKKLPSGGYPISYVNESFTKMTGYTLEEIKGKSLKFLIGVDTSLEERLKLREAMTKGLPARMEVINYKKSGERFWASISVFPVFAENGEITHWVSIQRDVTLRKNAEQEKEQLINELIHNNKELKQFSYITTHNLRAPLTNLLSICRLIDTAKIEDQRIQRLVEGFKQSTTLLNETLNDLINILIIKENRNLITQELSFSEVFEKVHTSISNTIKNASATIKTDFSAVDTINFSKAYLESIFLNLLTNSLKYSHSNKPLHINITTQIGADGCTKLLFSDNGIGMDMKRVKDRIFGLYQRFHNNTDSKGIGLYLIHSQITALGGTIEVESEVNKGTTFTITFK